MDLVVITYTAYLILSIAITVWVAQTLSKNGQLFLLDVFSGKKELASSVNHLLVVGFYLVNLGFVSLGLKLGYNVVSCREAIEALSIKEGTVLLTLGVMHFFNLFVFSCLRNKCNNQPPVVPDGFTEIGT